MTKGRPDVEWFYPGPFQSNVCEEYNIPSMDWANTSFLSCLPSRLIWAEAGPGRWQNNGEGTSEEETETGLSLSKQKDVSHLLVGRKRTIAAESSGKQAGYIAFLWSNERKAGTKLESLSYFAKSYYTPILNGLLSNAEGNQRRRIVREGRCNLTHHFFPNYFNGGSSGSGWLRGFL